MGRVRWSDETYFEYGGSCVERGEGEGDGFQIFSEQVEEEEERRGCLPRFHRKKEENFEEDERKDIDDGGKARKTVLLRWRVGAMMMVLGVGRKLSLRFRI